MPRVFRQQYTRPIPPDAERVTVRTARCTPTSTACVTGGPYSVLTGAPESGSDSLRLPETPVGADANGTAGCNPLNLQGVATGCDLARPAEMSSGGWDRTSDLGLMKTLL